MKKLNLFLAILALTFMAFFPAAVRADEGLEGLDVTLVVLDDPVVGLPEMRADAILRCFMDHQASDSIVVLSTSNPVALDLFDRLLELDAGRVVFDGSPEAWQGRGGAARLWGNEP